MTLKAVVFPAPFGPIRPAIWPSSTSKETLSSATIPPNRRETCRIDRRAMGRGTLIATGSMPVNVQLHARSRRQGCGRHRCGARNRPVACACSGGRGSARRGERPRRVACGRSLGFAGAGGGRRDRRGRRRGGWGRGGRGGGFGGATGRRGPGGGRRGGRDRRLNNAGRP